MSRLDEVTEPIKRAAGANSGLSKTLRFDLKGESLIFIDGGSVTKEEKPADVTLTLTIDDLKSHKPSPWLPPERIFSGGGHANLSQSPLGLYRNGPDVSTAMS
jgi:hypothetical protein